MSNKEGSSDAEEYEEQRRRAILRRKKFLHKLNHPGKPFSEDVKHMVEAQQPEQGESSSSVVEKHKNFRNKVKSHLFAPSRRSLRLMKRLNKSSGDVSRAMSDEFLDAEYGSTGDFRDLAKMELESIVKVGKRKNRYGKIKGVKIGTCWATRMQCSNVGIMRPPVSGIHPGKEGAYSVALSGNYDDNIDNGDSFVFSGSGGRNLRGTKDKPKNLRTAPQSMDQTADGPNASLIKSAETKNPIRVIRGSKLKGKFAPHKGYRYDGLYTVEDYWTCLGLSGHLVYKFFMRRCKNQPPAPWHKEFKNYVEKTDDSSTEDEDDTNGDSPMRVLKVKLPLSVKKAGEKRKPDEEDAAKWDLEDEESDEEAEPVKRAKITSPEMEGSNVVSDNTNGANAEGTSSEMQEKGITPSVVRKGSHFD